MERVLWPKERVVEARIAWFAATLRLQETVAEVALEDAVAAAVGFTAAELSWQMYLHHRAEAARPAYRAPALTAARAISYGLGLVA